MKTKNLSATRLNSSSIYLKVNSILKKYKKNNSFVVGVSGGPDSLALTTITNELAKKNKYKIFFAMVDHGLRKNSAKEATQVKKLLKKQKINLIILKNRLKIINNIQKKAREIRYKLLENFCKKKGAKSLIVAHHQDDQVETFLIRLSRGSGVEGLSSMQEMTILNNGTRLIRPFLDFKKIDLTNIAKRKFGKIFKDPSNKNKRFLRTNIRELKKNLVKNGLKIEKIMRSIKNIASTKQAIDFYVSESIKKVVSFERKITVINFKKFKSQPREIKFRIINSVVKKRSNSYYPPRSKKVFNLIEGFQTNRIKKCTLGGCIFERKKTYLHVSKEL
tara:strand:+ start:1141 stop:2139 length:999 start_codon:yes stop_codon:yes gene_type:complete